MLRNGIAVYELLFFPVIFQEQFSRENKVILSGELLFIIYVVRISIRYVQVHLIHDLVDENKQIQKLKEIRETKLHAILFFPAGSFAVQFGDHFRPGDHFRSGFICGAVQPA